MSPHGLQEAFAESVVRLAMNDLNIVKDIQSHLGAVDVSQGQIKAYLLGVRHGAMTAHSKAMSLFAPSINAYNRTSDVLREAITSGSINDMTALSLMQDALDIFDRERAEQVNRHMAIYPIRVEQKWGVAERFFLRGEEPTEEEALTIATTTANNMPGIIAMLSTYGAASTRFIMDPQNVGKPFPALLPDGPVPVRNMEVAVFVIESARIDYELLLEEASAAYEPAAKTQVDTAMDDIMSRLSKGASDGNAPVEG